MLRFPNAKINIGLYITGKRNDGYHDLETVFYPVQLKDALEITGPPVPGITIELSGLPVAGARENNLVWKAWKLLERDFPERITPRAIFLHKAIPMGGGMGGGSSDGAFMLQMMNDYFDLNLETVQLEAYALQLGSDCPFFIRNKPAFASGRGEVLEPLALDLSGYDIRLICPEIHISTAMAFAGIQPAAAGFNLRELMSLPVTSWRDHIRNDFEAHVFTLFPVLQQIKQQLYDQGALYASMSGSGATMYGIFEKGSQPELQTGIPYHMFAG